MSCRSSPSGRGLVTSSAASRAASSNYSHRSWIRQSVRVLQPYKGKVLCREAGEFIGQLSIKAGQVLHGDRQFVLAEVVVTLQLLPISAIGSLVCPVRRSHQTCSCTRSHGPGTS